MDDDERQRILDRACDLLDQADAERDELVADMAERRERIEFERATSPLPAYFSRCSSTGEMDQQQFAAWIDAGRPELPAAREAREARELQRRVEKAAGQPPASAPALVTVDWHAF